MEVRKEGVEREDNRGLFDGESCEIWKKWNFKKWKIVFEIRIVFDHEYKLELFLNFCEWYEMQIVKSENNSLAFFKFWNSRSWILKFNDQIWFWNSTSRKK